MLVFEKFKMNVVHDNGTKLIYLVFREFLSRQNYSLSLHCFKTANDKFPVSVENKMNFVRTNNG